MIAEVGRGENREALSEEMLFNPNPEREDRRQNVPDRWKGKYKIPKNGKCLGHPKTERWPVSLERRKRGGGVTVMTIFSLVLC